MNKVQALTSFWNSFGLKAYDETSVPDKSEQQGGVSTGAVLPYITFEVGTSDFDHDVALTGSLWYRDTSWAAITAKEMEIASHIGRGGLIKTYDGGAFWIRRGTPWAQRMGDSTDDSIRRIVMNIEIEFID